MNSNKKKKFNFSNLTTPILSPLTPLNPLSPRMDEIKKKEYKYSFSLFTSNDIISIEELKVVYERLGFKPTEEEMKDLLTEIDIDKNGTISFESYCALARRLEKYGDEELDMKAAFDLFDQEKNGYITEENLKQVMAAIGEDLTETQVKLKNFKLFS
jgi:Ca2+-binding EF-hand superfamily protein